MKHDFLLFYVPPGEVWSFLSHLHAVVKLISQRL